MYNWQPARMYHVPDCVALAQQWFETEVNGMFVTDPQVFEYNLSRAVLDQFYDPACCLVRVAVRESDSAVIGYTWATRGDRAVWSAEEMVTVRMAHCDMSLPARTRLEMIKGMMQQWELWCYALRIPVLCSTTMREDQSGFLRLHQQCGYTVRGSIAYKRMK